MWLCMRLCVFCVFIVESSYLYIRLGESHFLLCVCGCVGVFVGVLIVCVMFTCVCLYLYMKFVFDKSPYPCI